MTTEPLTAVLIMGITALIGVVWRNLNWRLKEHEERMHGIDSAIMYLREQAHTLRNMLPNPGEIEARRMETRENFNQLFSMMRDVEKRLNEINGELRVRNERDR